jgi:X-Pro dipeptidyl-peptidase
MQWRIRGMRMLGAPAVTVAVFTAVAVPAGASHADATPTIKVQGGETQPIFSRADAVYQAVDVQTTIDSDNDGERDTVRVRILRPKETERGLKVPVIMEPSPYWAGTLDIPNHGVDVDGDGLDDTTGERYSAPPESDRSSGSKITSELLGGLPGARAAAQVWSGYYDNYFLPRGYAVAQVDSIGSGGSTGCPTIGDRNETLGVKAAVDWLTGDAKGWDESGNPIRADWSIGRVALQGISYNGTLPNQVATTGAKGLKTIVPIAAISSWYDYYRAGGGVVAPGGYQGEDTDVMSKVIYTRADKEICKPVIADLAARQDRVSGDYSNYWAARDFLVNAKNVRVPVFLVHGLNDWNVKTKQFAQWWEALQGQVPTKLWLHQAGHSNPFNLRMEEWLRQLHHWYDHWLYGIENGIMREPRVDVEQADFSWKTQNAWPARGTRDVTLHLNSGPGGEAQPGTLSTAATSRVVQSMTDQGRTVNANILVDNETEASENRLAYLTPELSKDVHLNGTPMISVKASLEGTSPYLTALLVDYGTDTRATSGTSSDTSQQICYGSGVEGDTGCAFRSRHVTQTADFKIVTRGWLDARNRHDMARTEPITEGRMYSFGWEMQPEDYVFKKGHRIGVVLISTDYDYTLRYPAGTVMKVQTGAGSVRLPVEGGKSALG